MVDDGLEFVIRTEKAVLDKFEPLPPSKLGTEKLNENDSMNEWCVRQHGAVRLFSEFKVYHLETSSLFSPA